MSGYTAHEERAEPGFHNAILQGFLGVSAWSWQRGQGECQDALPDGERPELPFHNTILHGVREWKEGIGHLLEDEVAAFRHHDCALQAAQASNRHACNT